MNPSAYREGQQAQEDGLLETACPYDDRYSVARESWLKGWRETVLTGKINLILQCFGDTNPFSIGDDVHLVCDDSDFGRAEAELKRLIADSERCERLEKTLKGLRSEFYRRLECLDCHLDIESDEDAQNEYKDWERRIELVTAALKEQEG